MSMMDLRSFEYPAILFGDQTSFCITSNTPSVHLLPVLIVGYTELLTSISLFYSVQMRRTPLDPQALMWCWGIMVRSLGTPLPLLRVPVKWTSLIFPLIVKSATLPLAPGPTMATRYWWVYTHSKYNSQ